MKAMHILAASVLLAATAIPASATSILIDDANGTLGYVNTSTGAVTLLGSSGVGLTDIAFSSTGALYGVDFSNFYTINTTTGHATLVGATGDPTYTNALGYGPNGVLYTAGLNFDSINTATGHATVIASLGNNVSSGDLAALNGVLYLSTVTSGSDQLVSVNTTTGAVTQIGSLGISGVFGLASDGTTLYGTSGTSIYTINTTTGLATFDVSYAGHGLGQALGATIAPAATTVTPEPSGLVFLGTGVLSLAAAARRRLRNR